jgi:CRP-like cAMP-binding protein
VHGWWSNGHWSIVQLATPAVLSATSEPPVPCARSGEIEGPNPVPSAVRRRPTANGCIRLVRWRPGEGTRSLRFSQCTDYGRELEQFVSRTELRASGGASMTPHICLTTSDIGAERVPSTAVSWMSHPRTVVPGRRRLMSSLLAPRDAGAADVSRAHEADRVVAKNRLLEAIAPDAREALEPHLERVTLEIGDTLTRAGERWSYLYFPEGAAISVIKQMADGRSVEVGAIGNEGIVGLPAILGADTSEGDAIVPIPGYAVRAPVEVVLDVVHRRPQLLDVVHRYTQAYLAQVAQNAACNQLHGLEHRCARWLLATHDRVGEIDVLPLKHEYLAAMLGVYRPAVTVAVGALQKRGLISYRRGRMHVVDRQGLQAAACECYSTVRQQFDRLVPQSAQSRLTLES